MTRPVGDLSLFRRALVGARLLMPLTEGVFARSQRFEAIVDGVERAIHRLDEGRAVEQLRFPPVIPLDVLVRSGYPRSFPDMLAVLQTFQGGNAEHAALLQALAAGADWTAALSSSELALCSAACHPLYPLLAGRSVGAHGETFEVQAFCFRHEPSVDPSRMQVFRQHEFVCVGGPDATQAHRDSWVSRAEQLLTGLGLTPSVEVANDPFFGRAGRVLASSQREQALKLEVLCEIGEPGHWVAVSSGNSHAEHFGDAFDIKVQGGRIAHTACIGFGLERIALALLWKHGLEPDAWADEVRSALR